MIGFRQSRLAMLIDIALLPLGFFRAVLLAGLRAAVNDLLAFPSYVRKNWPGRHWISKD